jgi:TonB family protein
MTPGIFIAAWLAAQSALTPTIPCGGASGGQTQVSNEVCLGNAALARGEAAPKGTPERSDLFDAAASHYRRAAGAARNPDEKSRALDLLATAFDAQHLNDLPQEESALRDLIATMPTELTPLFRLADLQEHQGEIDAAEDTLLSARRREPDSTEPYKRLAQFYARRVAAMQSVTVKSAMADQPTSGTPDEKGVYRVGGGVTPPTKVDPAIPQYPKEAKALGVTGVVIVEIIVDETGSVADAKVLRSIPLLDEEALRAVRNWHFAPSVVNGQPVPVRMNVSVSFTDR